MTQTDKLKAMNSFERRTIMTGDEQESSPIPSSGMVEAARAAFEEGYRKAEETSMPAYLAWELSDTFESLKVHQSDCSVHNAPAEEPGPCDCDGVGEQSEIETIRAECDQLRVERNYWREQFIGKTVDASIAALTNHSGEALAQDDAVAPVQGFAPGIPWEMHMRAYAVYCERYGEQPALIDLKGRNCRGGFGTDELDDFIPGWREELAALPRQSADQGRWFQDEEMRRYSDERNADAFLAMETTYKARIQELGGALNDALNLIDELYRKYGCELDAADAAIAQFCRALLNEGEQSK